MLALACVRDRCRSRLILVRHCSMIFFPSNGDNSRHTGFMSVSRDSQGMPLNTGYRPGNASTRQTIISACAPVDVGFAARRASRSFICICCNDCARVRHVYTRPRGGRIRADFSRSKRFQHRIGRDRTRAAYYTRSCESFDLTRVANVDRVAQPFSHVIASTTKHQRSTGIHRRVGQTIGTLGSSDHGRIRTCMFFFRCRHVLCWPVNSMELRDVVTGKTYLQVYKRYLSICTRKRNAEDRK